MRSETLASPPVKTVAATPDRRQFLFGGALFAAAAAGVLLKPHRTAEKLATGMLDRAIPTTIGRYNFVTASGLVLPPQDEITERIYDQVLTRVYAAEGLPPIMLLIAYGSAQDYTLQAHLPEVCYPASGYEISGLTRLPVRLRRQGTARATFLSATRADRVEQVFYWLRIGTHFPTTLGEERLAVMAANLRGALPDGVLVRISTVDADRETALSAIERFNQEMLRVATPMGKALLGTDL